MKHFFKPARIGFYILMLLMFFIVGLYYAGFIDAGKNQGLAGGAIVLGYGVMIGGIAFVASFFIAHFLEVKAIKIINWILLILLLGTVGYTHYQFKQKNAQEEVENIPNPKKESTPTETTEPISVHSVMHLKNPLRENELGIGFFKPNFFEHPTLFFYGNVNLEKGVSEHLPQDSLVMDRNQYGDFTSTYAPPYLLPEYMKLDFGLFYFKSTGLSHDFVSIEVNKKNGQTAYLNMAQGDLQLWPEFLMGVNTVRMLNENQKVKIKPLEHASEVIKEYTYLKPLMVKEQWMQVVLKDTKLKTIGTGWIRWQKNGKLLISYDFLS